jgi:hypothetical protein
MKISWSGLVLTINYIVFAAWVAWDAFFHCGANCVIDLCGIGSRLITFPVSIPLSRVGLDVDLAVLQASRLHCKSLIIALYGILVYLIGTG